MRERRLRIYRIGGLQKKYPDRLCDFEYTGNYHIRIIMAYGSDEHALVLGYFLTERGNAGPLEKHQWKHFEKGEVWLQKHNIGNEAKIKEFTDYLDTHGVKWL